MTNEIKEILDDIRKTADNTNFVVCSSQEELDKMPRYTANFMSINDRKAKLLLDYITNLQEENERLKDYLKIMEKGKDNNLYRFLDYKQRIDKAIEYINKYEYEKYCPSPYEKEKYIMREEKEGQDLSNILRGDE